MSFAPFYKGHSATVSGDFVRERRFLIVSGTGDMPAAAKTIAGLPDRHYYLGGHVGLHDLRDAGISVEDTDIVFSLMRDPVERAVSLYFLMQRSPDWFLGIQENAKGRDFRYFYEFARDHGYYFHNDQCKLISGTERFEDAVRSMEKDFNLVGTYSNLPAFNHALAELCASVVPGFSVKPARENAAYHEQVQPDTWKKRSEIRDIVGTEFLGRIMRDHEQDIMLLHFIEHTHDGLLTTSKAVKRRVVPAG